MVKLDHRKEGSKWKITKMKEGRTAESKTSGRCSVAKQIGKVDGEVDVDWNNGFARVDYIFSHCRCVVRSDRESLVSMRNGSDA